MMKVANKKNRAATAESMMIGFTTDFCLLVLWCSESITAPYLEIKNETTI
jgi:hypothetical protein